MRKRCKWWHREEIERYRLEISSNSTMIMGPPLLVPSTKESTYINADEGNIFSINIPPQNFTHTWIKHNWEIFSGPQCRRQKLRKTRGLHNNCNVKMHYKNVFFNWKQQAERSCMVIHGRSLKNVWGIRYIMAIKQKLNWPNIYQRSTLSSDLEDLVTLEWWKTQGTRCF